MRFVERPRQPRQPQTLCRAPTKSGSSPCRSLPTVHPVPSRVAAARRRMASSSLSPIGHIRDAIRRGPGGKDCLNRARTVLCGGRSAMSVPTAIILSGASHGNALNGRTKACLQSGFPNRLKIDSRLKMEISLDSIDVERHPMGADCAGAVGQSRRSR
jgi:hypothetical protein